MNHYTNQIDTFMEIVRDEICAAEMKHDNADIGIGGFANVITEEYLEFVTALNDMQEDPNNIAKQDHVMKELSHVAATVFRFYQKFGATKNGRIPCFWSTRNRKNFVSDDAD